MTTQSADQYLVTAPNGDVSNLGFIDGQQTVIASGNNKQCSKYPVYVKSPYNIGRRELDLRSWKCADISSIGAAGAKFTPYGSPAGTISLHKGGTRSWIQVDTGTGAAGAGGVIEFPQFLVQYASFDYFYAMVEIPTGLHFQFDFGIWDGTQNNCIFAERFEAGSTQNYYLMQYVNGVRTGYQPASYGGDGNRWQFGIIKDTDDNTIKLIAFDPNNIGNWTLLATLSSGFPTGIDMWPFIRFESTLANTNRTLQIDQIHAGGNL